MQWNQWLSWATSQLKNSDTPKRDAEILLEQVLKKSRAQLLAFGETLLEHNNIIQLNHLITRRKNREPIAYIIGYKEFWSLNFKVSRGTFIPRPDTECLIQHTLDLFNNTVNLNVLDLGTGIGTIALSIASEQPTWNITGIDCQNQALKLAEKNKASFNLKNVKFLHGNWFQKLMKKKFNLIISNPPYISKNDPCLKNSDLIFEPPRALISQKSGLSDLTIISKYSTQHLCHNGWLIMEHGWNQGEYIRTLLKKIKFTNICTIRDHNHQERITCGKWIIY
ncbi:peptide chain release factor N(5)-glutamine methyltransferase [Candidatus Blochmannia ocreatus (nom. nud.)]|uniref:Release factor glutamine methyltransferase n=1 Tax=Candidatus Blochmannia ocreatus (nom. nud.) TaxID=251538 RepID=A0ABY4SYE5_9ENTR|nr:peptide chain release factor N(5)-glutamine methyltransferase [Candidatus Blochmannia ocreatus]URJ24859.1 peptide chain release factor N(5)-glutamine methyltransferase [Candidatus Blochmannia ocreatus]